MSGGKSMSGLNTQVPGGQSGQDAYNQYSNIAFGGQPQGPQQGFGFNPTNDMPMNQPPVGIQGNQPAPNTLSATGMGGGKSMGGPGQQPQDTYNQYTNAVFGGGSPAYQPNFAQPQGGLRGRDMSGSPNTTPLMGGMGTMATTPANRFIPPNAPGVRPGIPVQQARSINPPITRTRTR